MELTPLAPRARWLFHLQALMRSLIIGPPLLIGIGFGVAYVSSPWIGAGVASCAALILAVWTIWWPTLAFDRWGYALNETELLIQSGVLIRRINAIPSGRIQHVDTHQGPLDQLMELATVSVYTASGSGSDGVIPGLDKAEAARLRDTLIRRGGDDGV
jgi:membrane protein YdbS with pleckstrin-like domain